MTEDGRRCLTGHDADYVLWDINGKWNLVKMLIFGRTSYHNEILQSVETAISFVEMATPLWMLVGGSASLLPR